MQKFSALLSLGLLLLLRLGSAQQCPGGPADTIPNGGLDLNGEALRWTVPQARGTLEDVLRSLKYDVIEPAADTGAFETKPSYRFSDDPALKPLRHYKHPGVVVRAFVRPEGDSARLFVFAKSICRVAEAPPAGYTVPVETTFEVAAESEIVFGILDRLRREHPRRISCDLNPSSDVRVYNESQVSQLPVVVGGPAMEYPDTLRQLGKTGQVVYSVIINEDGSPDLQTIKLEHSDDYRFEWAARQWLRRARFSPGCRNGQAVRVRVSLPVDFKIPVH